VRRRQRQPAVPAQLLETLLRVVLTERRQQIEAALEHRCRGTLVPHAAGHDRAPPFPPTPAQPSALMMLKTAHRAPTPSTAAVTSTSGTASVPLASRECSDACARR